MHVDLLSHCCSAKWIHGIYQSYSSAELVTELVDAISKGRKMGYPKQAFFLLALNNDQYQSRNVQEALKEQEFKLIASGNGAHYTPVYLYCKFDDEIPLPKENKTEKISVKKESTFPTPKAGTRIQDAPWLK